MTYFWILVKSKALFYATIKPQNPPCHPKFLPCHPKFISGAKDCKYSWSLIFKIFH